MGELAKCPSDALLRVQKLWEHRFALHCIAVHDRGIEPLFWLGITMSKENITFRLDSGKRAALDEIAAGVDRDRSYLINEAITLYLEMHQWQIEEIHRGIAEADAGDFATEEEVSAVFARLTHGKAR